MYPPYGTALVEAHNRRFEAVFVILHPFIRLPEQLAWSVTRRYPTDSEIVAEGSACTWTEVGAANRTEFVRASQSGVDDSDRITQRRTLLITREETLCKGFCNHSPSGCRSRGGSSRCCNGSWCGLSPRVEAID